MFSDFVLRWIAENRMFLYKHSNGFYWHSLRVKTSRLYWTGRKPSLITQFVLIGLVQGTGRGPRYCGTYQHWRGILWNATITLPSNSNTYNCSWTLLKVVGYSALLQDKRGRMDDRLVEHPRHGKDRGRGDYELGRNSRFFFVRYSFGRWEVGLTSASYFLRVILLVCDIISIIDLLIVFYTNI